MNNRTPIIELRGAPHLRKAPSVDQIMRNVVYALLPICGFAVYQFGLSALALILATTLACICTEHLFCRLSDKPTTIGDFSAVITGLLLALTLPPGFPLWMAVVAGFVAIALTKVMFGGIGFNVFNPALVGRAFVQAAFPVAITTWTPAFAPGRFTEFIPSTLTLPFVVPKSVAGWVERIAVDGYTGATPLALQKFGDGNLEHVTTQNADLFFGMTAGSAGETSALLILVCGIGHDSVPDNTVRGVGLRDSHRFSDCHYPPLRRASRRCHVCHTVRQRGLSAHWCVHPAQGLRHRP